MHNNYYYLRQLSAQLERKLTGWTLVLCFSQEKDELVLGFYHNKEEFYLKAVLRPDLACLTFPENFHRARRNSVDLMEEIMGCTVEGVVQYENERSFALRLSDGYLLLFKMHGNRSNLVLFKGEEVVELFHHRLAGDEALRPGTLHRPLDQSYEAFLRNDRQVSRLYPTLGKVVNEYLRELGFAQMPPETQWETLQRIVAQLDNPVFYLTLLDELPALTLLRLGDVQEQTDDPIRAANQFYFRYARVSFLDHEKREAARDLLKRKAQTESYIAKNYEKLDELANQTRHGQVADLIMANLHQITPFSESVELLDFYHGRPVKIKLKKDLSAQRNAEVYYRKAKNEKIEVQNLEEAIARKEADLAAINGHLQALEGFENVKELRKYLKDHGLAEDKAPDTPEQLFRQYEYLGFQVWMGRNARNNDLLTLQYARKEDLWLHAKDVSGSHVVIRQQSGQNFPEPVIMKAAALAAYHSKKRNDTVCPVTVTPRKYVRKPKGLPDGAVIVEREKVVLVRPADWSMDIGQ